MTGSAFNTNDLLHSSDRMEHGDIPSVIFIVCLFC